MKIGWGNASGTSCRPALTYQYFNVSLKALAVVLINIGALCASLSALCRSLAPKNRGAR